MTIILKTQPKTAENPKIDEAVAVETKKLLPAVSYIMVSTSTAYKLITLICVS